MTVLKAKIKNRVLSILLLLTLFLMCYQGIQGIYDLFFAKEKVVWKYPGPKYILEDIEVSE